MTSVADSPLNSRWPVSISWTTTPKAQISARLSTGLPRACSGLMYAAVPNSSPRAVCTGVVIVGEFARSPAGIVAISFARPKSSTLTTPSSRTLMLAGFKSR